ncbi:MAG: hypothetical protein U9R25_14590 [Chloroflexota bacterium]|nr:hypothetical protein [Chloroflexota bacterium]
MAKSKSKRSRKRRDWRQILLIIVSLLIVLSMALAFLPLLVPGQ